MVVSASADTSGSPQDTSQWMTLTEDSLCGPPPRHHNVVFCVDYLQGVHCSRCDWPQWKEWGTQQRGAELDLTGRGKEGTWYTHGPQYALEGDSHGLD